MVSISQLPKPTRSRDPTDFLNRRNLPINGHQGARRRRRSIVRDQGDRLPVLLSASSDRPQQSSSRRRQAADGAAEQPCTLLRYIYIFLKVLSNVMSKEGNEFSKEKKGRKRIKWELARSPKKRKLDAKAEGNLPVQYQSSYIYCGLNNKTQLV